jgi:hypothetical protein
MDLRKNLPGRQRRYSIGRAHQSQSSCRVAGQESAMFGLDYSYQRAYTQPQKVVRLPLVVIVVGHDRKGSSAVWNAARNVQARLLGFSGLRPISSEPFRIRSVSFN